MCISKKEKIFNAIFEAILESGDVSNIRVSDIAKRAGIGKGSVYMYFSNKEHMMFEAVKYFVESTMKSLLEYETDEIKGFKKLMCGFLYEHLNLLKKYSSMFYSTVSTEFFPLLTPELREKMVGVIAIVREKYQKKIVELIEIGVSEKIISKTPEPFQLLTVSQMLFSASGHFSQKDIPVVSNDVDEYVSMMYDMAVKMLN